MKHLLCTLMSLAFTLTAPAQVFSTLASFNGNNGAYPQYGVFVQGKDGTLYGSTPQGGAPLPGYANTSNDGVVFSMTPAGAITVLWDFGGAFTEGQNPNAPLVQGSDGALYGTTQNGGLGSGTVFKITPDGVLTIIYSFSGPDGFQPLAGLIQGSDGNFYGTTYAGGVNNAGTIFKITPGGNLTTLYSCTANSAYPKTALIQATDGNFYGTASSAIFKISPSGAFSTVAYSTSNSLSGLVQATDGNFYGTTSIDDTVFRVTPSGVLTTLYNFGTAATDGYDTSGPLIQASDGNLYGLTALGGVNGGGTIYSITLSGQLTTLYSFCAETECTDGENPGGTLLQAGNGQLYGTTYMGGQFGEGAAFRFTLPASPTVPVINPTGGIVSSASYQPGIVPGSWVSIFGTNLASQTDNWGNSIVNGELPTSLDGVSVSVNGQPAYVDYISPTQINVIAPSIGAGTATIMVTTPSGTSTAVSAVAQSVQPGFFQWGTYAVATHQNYTYAIKGGFFPGLSTVAAKPGEVIILWGTGFGPTTPTAPVGVVTPSNATYYTANPVQISIGGVAATVYGTALSPGYAGLYQVAIQIPASLSNGDYPVVASILGAQSPLSVLITVEE